MQTGEPDSVAEHHVALVLLLKRGLVVRLRRLLRSSDQPAVWRIACPEPVVYQYQPQPDSFAEITTWPIQVPLRL